MTIWHGVFLLIQQISWHTLRHHLTLFLLTWSGLYYSVHATIVLPQLSLSPGSNSYSSVQHGGLNSSLSSQSFISLKNWQCPFHFESKKSSTNIKSKTVLATGVCPETICSSLCLDYNLLDEAQVTSEKAVSWIVYAFYMQYLFSICDVLDAVVIKRRAKFLLFSSTCWLQMVRVITEEPRKEQ